MVFKQQMLQAANTDFLTLFNPKARVSKSILFPLKIKPLKVSTSYKFADFYFLAPSTLMG